MLVHMARRPRTVHSLLDAFLALPPGSSDAEIEAVIFARNPGSQRRSHRSRLSEGRKAVHPVVRTKPATISAYAAQKAGGRAGRYYHAWMEGARCVRDGKPFPD